MEEKLKKSLVNAGVGEDVIAILEDQKASYFLLKCSIGAQQDARMM
jgi:hypothetical protein